MKNEYYFENVEGIGNLYLGYIFFEFENEPILFSAMSEDNQLYLCLCTEIRYYQKWLISKCDLETAKNLISERVDIVTALSIPETTSVVISDENGRETSRIEKTKEIDELDFPEKGTFVICNTEEAKEYILNLEIQYTMFDIKKLEFDLGKISESVKCTEEKCERVLYNLENGIVDFAYEYLVEEEQLSVEIEKFNIDINSVCSSNSDKVTYMISEGYNEQSKHKLKTIQGSNDYSAA